MTNFACFGISTPLIESLERMLITTPTPIQKETIPLALNGLDILATAHTGTGKTVAYLVPLIMKLSQSQGDTALILAPTRELATQVHQALLKMLGKSPIKTALLIGGASMFKQFADLRKRPRILVGTPGRITDHILRESVSLETTRFLIIDEADRMLDMGFGPQLDKIAEYLPEQKQTLMFSATLAPNIERLSKKYLKNPQRVSIDSTVQTSPKIKQEMIRTSVVEKLPQLLKQLNEREGSIIVFVKTKRRAESLSRELKQHGHNTDAMHGDLPQRGRERVIQMFRNCKSRIMVATDIAARGLDIPHVMHVINFDLPDCPEEYVHRIGRTGRADAEGFALSLVSPEDTSKWNAIFKWMNPDAKNEGSKGSKMQPNSPSRDNPQKSRRRSSFWDKKKEASKSHEKPFNGNLPRKPEGQKTPFSPSKGKKRSFNATPFTSNRHKKPKTQVSQ